jgi:uncharacterized protein YciI
MRRLACTNRGAKYECPQQWTCPASRVLFHAMYALAIIRYRRPLEEVLATVDDHRAYLRGLKAKGVLLASGPFDPRVGGALLLRIPDENVQSTLDGIRDGDPFVKQGLAQYELLPWLPNIGAEALEEL